MLKKYIENNRCFESLIKREYPIVYNNIINYSTNRNVILWSEKLYNYYYSIIEAPTCKNDCCNNKTKFSGRFNKGYRDFCSKKCASQSKLTRDKVIETNLEKYGVSNPNKLSSFVEKRIETNLEKYGVKCTLQSKLIKEKIKETNLEKYGVENVSQSKLIKKRVKDTNLEKYGVENVYQSEIIKEKIKETNLEKYGVENVSQSKLIKEKKRETNLEKYGVFSTLQIEKSKENLKKTIKEKYGVEYPLQSKTIRDKSKKTIKEKYGADFISQTIFYKNKINDDVIDIWTKKLKLNDDDILYSDNVFTIKNFCKKHDEFNITYDNLYNRIYQKNNICTECYPISELSSIKEKELVEFIKSLNVNHQINDRKILDGKELDIYLPEHSVAIEFNGLYWHSDKFVGKKYHLNKTEECEKQGIQLLHVFEDEWVNKESIVKSIINNKLKLCNNKIFARKCSIKKINDNKIVREFLDNNHIQGFVGSNIKIGLYYNDELVSLMTFIKTRKSIKSNELSYELNRFCNKLNTVVIGGAGKLLKYFNDNYTFDEIISFADRRYSDGGLYYKLGFQKIKINKPNYSYISKTHIKRHHRFNFRKERLNIKDENFDKTEFEIMNERGYHRIYDSGNIKFRFITT